jgi:hypothetical protein
MAEHSDMCLSSQLYREAQIGGLLFRWVSQVRPYLKNNQQKKDWWSGSNGRLPT